MWWRFGLLALFDLVVLVVFLVPAKKVEVTVDLPVGGGPPPSAQAVQHGADMVVAVVGAAVILALISLNVWLVKRMLRARDRREGA